MLNIKTWFTTGLIHWCIKVNGDDAVDEMEINQNFSVKYSIKILYDKETKCFF